jgi:hypothetical protein
MKWVLRILTLSICLTACGRRQETQLSTAEKALRQQLLGTWISGVEKPGIGWSGGVLTMRQDSTFVSRYTNRWANGSKEFAYEGTWTVKDRAVLFTYTKTSELKVVPAGTTDHCQIVRLDDQEFAWQDLSRGITNIWVLRRKK